MDLDKLPSDLASKLSDAERDVAELVLRGLLSKQIANELGVSVRTIEQRRRRVFSKLGINSGIDLVKLVARQLTNQPGDPPRYNRGMQEHNTPITVYLHPGGSSSELLGELLLSLSAVYGSLGGSGLRISHDEHGILANEGVA